MHINMKYYIVTISAIFIALGIGLLLGFNLNSDGVFSKQQTQMVNQLEDKFKNIKSENQRLEDKTLNLTKENENLNTYIESTYGSVVDNRLLGKNIGIIQTSEDYFFPNVKDFIYKAKGNIAFEVVIKDTIKDFDFNILNTELGITIKDKNELVQYICKMLFENKNVDFVNKLSEKGLIEVKLLNLNFEKLDNVVIEGGSISEKNNFDLKDKNIISYFKSKNVALVGAERVDSKFSFVQMYKKNKISTIDNIDSILGEISLIMVLQGKEGHFGVKESSEKFMPFEVK